MTYSSPRRNLIVGMPGSGKTTLAEYMKGVGRFALGADLVEGLGVWHDDCGRQMSYYDSTPEWRNSHRFSWDRGRLNEVLFLDRADDSQPLYLFGAAPNIYHHSCLFHTVIAFQA